MVTRFSSPSHTSFFSTVTSSITGAAPGPPGISRASCAGCGGGFSWACCSRDMVGPRPSGGGGPATGAVGHSSQAAMRAARTPPAASHARRRRGGGAPCESEPAAVDGATRVPLDRVRRVVRPDAHARAGVRVAAPAAQPIRGDGPRHRGAVVVDGAPDAGGVRAALAGRHAVAHLAGGVVTDVLEAGDGGSD